MFEILVAQSLAAVKAAELCVPFPEHAFARAALSRLSTPLRAASLGSASRPMRAVSRQPSLTFLSGPEGCGKSFLSRHAIRELLQQRPKSRFVIAKAAEVAELMAFADERQSLADLLDEFCSLDVFVCEDLHELSEDGSSTNEQARERLLELIDSALEGGPNVLLTSRVLPGELRGFSTRWVSRCHGGLMTSLSFPSHESRRMLIAALAHQKHIPLAEPSDVTLDWLAEKWASSARNIAQQVAWLEEIARQRGAVVDIAFLERCHSTKETAHAVSDETLSFDAIAGVVASEFHIAPDELRSRSRNQGLIVPRQCAMLLAKELTGLPLEIIGSYFGERTHTTVSHCLHRIKELLPKRPTLRQQVQKLRKRLAELRKSDCA